MKGWEYRGWWHNGNFFKRINGYKYCPSSKIRNIKSPRKQWFCNVLDSEENICNVVDNGMETGKINRTYNEKFSVDQPHTSTKEMILLKKNPFNVFLLSSVGNNEATLDIIYRQNVLEKIHKDIRKHVQFTQNLSWTMDLWYAVFFYGLW